MNICFMGLAIKFSNTFTVYIALMIEERNTLIAIEDIAWLKLKVKTTSSAVVKKKLFHFPPFH